jgi:hypothetical protein
MASEDGRVYIHDASDYALRTVCTKMPTAIKTLDWSLDSKWVEIALTHVCSALMISFISCA